MTIPIANPVISEAARTAVDGVLQSGMIADGKEVRAFEREFADHVGTEHAVATTNGTTALHGMLEAAGIGEGEAVVTTPFSFVASSNAIVHAGAEPVFGDIDPETYNLDPETVRDIVAERCDVVAILPVHLYGLPADMDEFQVLAEEHDLLLFEDAAQAHGATYGGGMVGGCGEAAAFSFYPTKNMTTGEGGMVTTDNDGLAERLRRLIDHGREGQYHHAEVGYNYRMTNVAAAIGRDQLNRLPGWVEERQTNAAALNDRLTDLDGLTVPTVPENREHAYHQYTVRVADRERVSEALDDADISYGIYYPDAIPDQPAYDNVSATVPHAAEASDAVLSLPIHPGVPEDGIKEIARAVRRGLEVSA